MYGGRLIIHHKNPTSDLTVSSHSHTRSPSLIRAPNYYLFSLILQSKYSAEVAKTRLQLQGELQSKGTPKVYKNVFDVFFKTWRNEGIRGVQRGLGPAVSCERTYVLF